MNFEELLRQADRVKSRIEEARESAARQTVQGEAGDGAVVVEASGNGEIRAVRIAPALLDPSGQAQLESLLVLATNQALVRALERMHGELARATGGALPAAPDLA